MTKRAVLQKGKKEEEEVGGGEGGRVVPYIALRHPTYLTSPEYTSSSRLPAVLHSTVGGIPGLTR